MEVHIELVLKHIDRDRYAPSFFVARNPFTPVVTELVDNVRDLGVPIVTDRASRLSRPGQPVDNVLGFARVVRETNASVVHMHHWKAGGDRFPLLAAKLARTRAVVRTEHLPPLDDDVTDDLKRFCKRYDRMCDIVLHVSRDNRDQHLTRLGRDPNRLQVLHNGIEVPALPDTSACRRAKVTFGFDPDVPLLGGLGRLEEQKGYRFLVAALPTVIREFGPVNVALVGEGALRDELEQQARALDVADNVRFMGFMKDPGQIVEAFDIAVMPSLFEGLSLSMLELMAAAKPCVFSDHRSFAEATDDGEFARLFPIGDADALARQLIGLLRDPAGAGALGARARNHVIEHFSIERHIANLMDVYDRILDH
jgi:glycosyltransferase involved in cell wall biosynthesis